MNTLPVVLSTLFMLTIATSTILEKHKDSKRFLAAHHLSHRLHSQLQDKFHEARYKRIKNPSAKGKSITKNSSSKEKKPPEKKNEPKRCAKLNLFPLLSLENPEESPIYQTFVQFVVQRYSKAPFSKNLHLEKTAQNLLDSILTAAKRTHSQKEPICIEKLQLTNKSMQSLFYKLLKGTNMYRYENPKTYPSLVEYVTIDEKEYHKICFSHAPKEILSAIYSAELAEAIFALYKEEGKLTKKLLEKTLNEGQLGLDEEKIKLFTFSHKQSDKIDPLTFRLKDDLTGKEAEVKKYLSN